MKEKVQLYTHNELFRVANITEFNNLNCLFASWNDTVNIHWVDESGGSKLTCSLICSIVLTILCWWGSINDDIDIIVWKVKIEVFFCPYRCGVGALDNKWTRATVVAIPEMFGYALDDSIQTWLSINSILLRAEEESMGDGGNDDGQRQGRFGELHDMIMIWYVAVWWTPHENNEMIKSRRTQDMEDPIIIISSFGCCCVVLWTRVDILKGT